MTLYSDSCFGVNSYRLFAQIYAALHMFYGFCVRLCTVFVYIYVFCVRLCTDFAHDARIFRTLRGICVRIWLIFCASCAAFAYVYGFCALWAALRTYTAYILQFSMWTVSRDPILQVPSIDLSAQAARYYWIVSTIQYWGFCQFLCPRELLVIHRPILPRRFLCCSW